MLKEYYLKLCSSVQRLVFKNNVVSAGIGWHFDEVSASSSVHLENPGSKYSLITIEKSVSFRLVDLQNNVIIEYKSKGILLSLIAKHVVQITIIPHVKLLNIVDANNLLDDINQCLFVAGWKASTVYHEARPPKINREWYSYVKHMWRHDGDTIWGEIQVRDRWLFPPQAMITLTISNMDIYKKYLDTVIEPSH